jgi:hypothetical protein
VLKGLDERGTPYVAQFLLLSSHSLSNSADEIRMPFESANTKQGALSPAARGLGATDFASSAAAMMDVPVRYFS